MTGKYCVERGEQDRHWTLRLESNSGHHEHRLRCICLCTNHEAIVADTE